MLFQPLLHRQEGTEWWQLELPQFQIKNLRTPSLVKTTPPNMASMSIEFDQISRVMQIDKEIRCKRIVF